MREHGALGCTTWQHRTVRARWLSTVEGHTNARADDSRALSATAEYRRVYKTAVDQMNQRREE